MQCIWGDWGFADCAWNRKILCIKQLLILLKPKNSDQFVLHNSDVKIASFWSNRQNAQIYNSAINMGKMSAKLTNRILGNLTQKYRKQKLEKLWSKLLKLTSNNFV